VSASKESKDGKRWMHSRWKNCLCGGHNHNNPKRSKTHHSTRSRMLTRKARTTRGHP
jgi:hypothetical protein